MSEPGPAYARLYDACEARGWYLELAGAVEGPLVLEIHTDELIDPIHRQFRIPRGRTIEQAAAALLAELAEAEG